MKTILLIGVGAVVLVAILIFYLIPLFVPTSDPNASCSNPKLVYCTNFSTTKELDTISCETNDDCSWDNMRDSCYPQYVEIPRCSGMVYECKSGFCVSYRPITKSY